MFLSQLYAVHCVWMLICSRFKMTASSFFESYHLRYSLFQTHISIMLLVRHERMINRWEMTLQNYYSLTAAFVCLSENLYECVFQQTFIMYLYNARCAHCFVPISLFCWIIFWLILKKIEMIHWWNVVFLFIRGIWQFWTDSWHWDFWHKFAQRPSSPTSLL